MFLLKFIDTKLGFVLFLMSFLAVLLFYSDLQRVNPAVYGCLVGGVVVAAYANNYVKWWK